MASAKTLAPITDEFAGAELGDRRRERRLETISVTLEREPVIGFPGAFESDAALEGFYRFINNDGFSAEDIVEPHRNATQRRMTKTTGDVLVIHDSSSCQFSGKSRLAELGIATTRGKPGFIAHVSLMVTEEEGIPLGIPHVETISRHGGKGVERRRGARNQVHKDDSDRESLRWVRGVDATRSRSTRNRIVHVTDAEGDFYEFLSHMHQHGDRFVVRAGQLDRVVEHRDETVSLRHVANLVRPIATREVELSTRSAVRRVPAWAHRRHPPRSGRVARMTIGACELSLKPTKYVASDEQPFPVSLVRVWERRPPAGQPAVEWVLITSEDVSSPEAAARVVDIYRKRWLIEEYFKALKTGCSFEKRQIESYDALRKVLMLFIPIAYRLLLMRALERHDVDTPATKCFADSDLTIMAAAPANRRFQSPRTIAEAMASLARMGGHIKSNGPPGWLVLGRGYEQLLNLRLGWELAMAQRRSDQS